MGNDELEESSWQRLRSSKCFIYTVINIAIFTDSYLYGLVMPVLPFALVSIAHVEEDSVQQWIGILVGAHGAGVLVGSPIAGYFADRSASRRIPFLLGLMALAASTVAFSVGRSTTVLLVGRLMQGASTASIQSVGLAILADTAGDGGVGSVMGVVDMSTALGATLSPVCGGFLYYHFGYLAVFESAYVLIGLDFALRLLMRQGKASVLMSREDGKLGTTPRSASPDEEVRSRILDGDCEHWESPSLGSFRGDYGSISSSASGLEGSRTISAPNESSSDIGFESSESLLQKSPLTGRPPMLELLSSPRMNAALLAGFMQSVMLNGLEAVIPLRIKSVFPYSSKGVSVIFLTLALPSFASPAIGKLSDKFGANISVSVGFLSLSPLLMLLGAVNHYDTGEVVLLCTLLLLIGTCMNMVMTPVFSDVTYLVKEKEAAQLGVFGPKGAQAQAFALMGVAYAFGSLLGPLLAGFVLKKAGWTTLTFGAGILCALCVVPCFCALGGKKK